jgi:hypothetical protein
MPPRQKTKCCLCGEWFSCGWPIINHQKWHKSVDHLHLSPVRDEAGVDVENAGVLDDDPGMELDIDVGDVAEAAAAALPNNGQSVPEYLEQLAETGALDNGHVMQYVDWGVHQCNPAHGTMLRFLRAMHGGTGASRRQGQEMLSFVNGLGDSGWGMPNTIKQCWAEVDKVAATCGKYICKVHLGSDVGNVHLKSAFGKYFSKCTFGKHFYHALL